ncbi:hypothetical protein IWX49DRAFT_350822 [Phyllosticta citricarpa]
MWLTLFPTTIAHASTCTHGVPLQSCEACVELSHRIEWPGQYERCRVRRRKEPSMEMKLGFQSTGNKEPRNGRKR